eukprot:TRINITY_DN3851_c0_g1_i1.p1 TRINITY_DN3851_c0_g1~~TRINITY_DN3851_c0_g1_i1.p1  ORF type:complete len:868 (+),score=234.20 TRINITY_DN3851_c0_g1_i1:376-2604(+)
MKVLDRLDKESLARASQAVKAKGGLSYEVTFTLANQVNLASLSAFLSGQSNEVPRTALQALDVAMRYYSSLQYLTVKRCLFYPDDDTMKKKLGYGGELWFGHYQSLRPTQRGLMLNMDVAAVAMVEPGPLLEHLVARLGLRQIDQLKPHHAPQMRRFARGLTIQISYRGKRNYKIRNLDSSPDDHKFESDNKQVSVTKYFQEKYKLRLRYPHLPCVVVGTGDKVQYLPIELCTVVKGFKFNGVLREQQKKIMVEETCLPPQERREFIEMGCPNAQQDPYMQAFGLNLRPEMVQVKGRLLPAPRVAYKNGDEAKVQDGVWSLSNKSFVNPARIDNYGVFLFGGVPAPDCCEALSNLVRTAQSKGMTMGRLPNPVEMDYDEQAFEAACQGKNYQLVICVLPSRNDPFYDVIKQIAETKVGVPTQCIDAAKLLDRKKGGPAYQANLAMKMNAKVGGSNHTVANALPIVSQRPTMVIGIDVHHPPVGNTGGPSIAAVVGSYDPKATSYHTEISYQPHREERVLGLKASIIKLLRTFYEKSGRRKPEHLIVYRDGVGEGFFELVVVYEVRAIFEACKALDPVYKPKLTFIVVQKRNRTKLFFDNEAQKNQNLQAGTVVDTVICDPRDFDFFMCSHPPLKGTSKPSHYHVIWDDANVTADQLQQLTYQLCYTYARCTRAVSIPAPAYYAHLAAYRARLYMVEDDSLSVLSGEGGRRRKTLAQLEEECQVLARNAPKLLPAIANALYFC